MIQEEELKEEYATYSEHITRLIRDSKEDALVIFSPKNSQEKPDYVQMVRDSIVFRTLWARMMHLNRGSDVMKTMADFTRIMEILNYTQEAKGLVESTFEKIKLSEGFIKILIKYKMEEKVVNGIAMSQKIRNMMCEINRKTTKEEPTINLNGVSNKTILFDVSMIDACNGITFFGKCENVIIRLPEGMVCNNQANCEIDTMEETIAQEIENVLHKTYNLTLDGY